MDAVESRLDLHLAAAFPCVEYRTRSLQLAHSILLHASHTLLACCTCAGRHLDGFRKRGGGGQICQCKIRGPS